MSLLQILTLSFGKLGWKSRKLVMSAISGSRVVLEMQYEWSGKNFWNQICRPYCLNIQFQAKIPLAKDQREILFKIIVFNKGFPTKGQKKIKKPEKFWKQLFPVKNFCLNSLPTNEKNLTHLKRTVRLIEMKIETNVGVSWSR